MESLFGIILLVIVIGLALLPVAIYKRITRKNRPVKTKEEKRDETITAIVIILILTLLLFVRNVAFDNKKDEILEGSNYRLSE